MSGVDRRCTMFRMPIYEYTCSTCAHRFEELVSADGRTLVACPECASSEVTKLFSSFAMRSSSVGGDMPRASMGGGGGGCCGGGCGCGH
jgi:putative FmdB family regulatory protein